MGLSLGFVLALASGLWGANSRAGDLLKELQTNYATHAMEPMERAYHFGSQRAGDVFSNHASHSNRLVPVYVFGRKVDLGAVTGENSRYRDPEKIKALYGFLPENTVNPEAEYGDQSDLYRVQKDAVAEGSSTSSSSGSTASTGRPPRPRRSSRRARSTPRGRARA